MKGEKRARRTGLRKGVKGWRGRKKRERKVRERKDEPM